MYGPPPIPGARTEGRSVASLLLAVFGLLITLTGVVVAGLAFLTGNGDLLNGLLLGFPAMILGAIAYFLGRSGAARVGESPSTRGGRATAVAGWVIGAVCSAVGAVVTLTWLVLVLLANNPSPPA